MTRGWSTWGSSTRGTYNLSVSASGYATCRAKVQVPVANGTVEVRLKELRTLKVTVALPAGGQPQKVPAGIEVGVLQALGPGEPLKKTAKVSAKGFANCAGVVDGPACLTAIYRGCVVASERITIDGDGEHKIELQQGVVSVKGKMQNVPKALAVQAIWFVCARYAHARRRRKLRQDFVHDGPSAGKIRSLCQVPRRLFLAGDGRCRRRRRGCCSHDVAVDAGRVEDEERVGGL